MKRIGFLGLGIFLIIALMTPTITYASNLAASDDGANWEVVKKLAVKGVPLMGPPSSGPKPHAATGTIGEKIKGSGYAIIIGISDYPGPANIFEGGYDLSYAADDARVMKKALVDVYGFEETNISLLLDNAANREAILGKIADLARTVSRDDEVVFFFSGHSAKFLPKLVPAQGGGEVGIVTWGWENPQNPADLYLEVIWDKELKEAFRPFQTDRIVFIFDICQAAGMIDLGGKGRIIAMATTQTGIAGEAYPGEFPYQGFFTYFFVELGMNEGWADFYPADGYVTIEEAFDFARFMLEYWSGQFPGFWQIPTIMDSSVNDWLL